MPWPGLEQQVCCIGQVLWNGPPEGTVATGIPCCHCCCHTAAAAAGHVDIAGAALHSA
jgi:hypothetical protein